MPNVAEVIRDHVTLTVDGVDRLYLNAYVPRLQAPGWWGSWSIGVRPSLAGMGAITGVQDALQTWCEREAFPGWSSGA
jgi:hypothetical protein